MPSTSFHLSAIVWLLSLALVLSGCDPKLPEPDPLPASLRVDARPDSTMATPDKIDFSTVSEVGQGPTGSLIRRNLVGAPGGNYYAYTYDEQSRLVGSFERTSYGYNALVLVRYQGSYRTEAYTGIRYPDKPADEVRWASIAKYQYDAQNRLGQVLIYQNVADTLKLNQTIQYEYGNTGHLQLTRHTNSLAFSEISSRKGVYPTELRYWVNGDYHRLETYQPDQHPITPIDRLFYNQVSNPAARLHIWPENLVSEHYFVGSGPSASGPEREEYQYRYQYDAKGRLTSVQQRGLIDNNTRWTEWSYPEEFVYAP